MEDLHRRIIDVLKTSPADQFSIYRQVETVTLANLSKAMAQLQQQEAIHVVGYRKSGRTGTRIPIYSLEGPRPTGRPDLVRLLSGVTSERTIEYEFLERNIPSSRRKAVIADFGSYWRELDLSLRQFGEGSWRAIGVDQKRGGCDLNADRRSVSLRTGSIDEVICISTLEHIGLSATIADAHGDQKAIGEAYRVLRKGGIAVLTVPYGKASANRHGRVYDRHDLQILLKDFAVTKKEFYSYQKGRWKKCSQAAADRYSGYVPSHLHSGVCACIALTKR